MIIQYNSYVNRKITYKIESSGYNPNFSTFDIEKGKKYFLIGENGIGKTTLLKVISDNWSHQYKGKIDISFEAHIGPEDIRWLLKRYDELSENDIDIVIEEFKSGNYRVHYDDSKNVDFDNLRRKTTELIVKNKKNKIENLFGKIERLMIEASEQLSKIKVELETYLQVPVKRIDVFTSDNPHIEIRDAQWRLKDLEDTEDVLKIFNDQLSEFKKYIYNESDNGKLNLRFRFIDFHSNSYENEYKDFRAIQEELEKAVSEISSLFAAARSIASINVASYLNHPFTRVLDFSNPYISKMDLSEFINAYPSVIKNLNKRIKKDNYNNELGLSRGEEILVSLKSVLNNNYDKNETFILDEPFVSLDTNNTQVAREIIYSSTETAMIATHSIQTIFPDDIPNIIVMFYDNNGKRCIANIDKISKLRTEDISTLFASQINQSLLNWYINNFDKTILLVEGPNDYMTLRKSKLLDDIEIIPVHSCHYMHIALETLKQKHKDLFILLDNDRAGNSISSILKSISKERIDITKEIYADTGARTLEELITKKEISKNQKRTINKNIKNDLFNEEIDVIAKKILGIINKNKSDDKALLLKSNTMMKK